MRMPLVRLAVVAGLSLMAAGCVDSPSLPDAPATPIRVEGPGYDELQGCVSDPDGVCAIGGVVVNPGAPPPDCNVWYSPSCGECMTGGVISGPNDMQVSSVCTGGGGTGPAPGGTDPYAPGGGAGPGAGTTPQLTTYQQGPLLWGACVLAVLGSVYTIDQVAGAFEGWWNAQQQYESARRMLNAIQANSANMEPATVQLWEFQVQYYENRRDDAVAAVREKTGGTGWALLGAGAACGAAAFMPTP